MESFTEYYKIDVDFAYKTFIWHNEANLKAHVHVLLSVLVQWIR